MQRRMFWRLLVLWVAGVMSGLLLARLVARLLAARPDHLVFQVLYALTDPIRLPLALLDAHQPRFGAVLELSTLVIAISVPVLGYVLWWWLGRFEKEAG